MLNRRHPLTTWERCSTPFGLARVRDRLMKRGEVSHEVERLNVMREQLQAVERVRNETLVSESDDKMIVIAQRLHRLHGIGAETATVLAREAFYRRFDNRRQLASFAGLTPTPYASGARQRDRVSRRPAMSGYATCGSNSPGLGCATSREAGWHSGTVREPTLDPARGRLALSLSHASCSSRCGGLLKTG